MADRSRHLLIAQLLADGTLNDGQRAEIAHCSLRTIGRVRRELREEIGDDEDVLAQYQAHIREQLPLRRCVQELIKLVMQDAHLPTKLAAIKRVQELLGAVTLKEMKKVEEKRQPGPMFIFPVNSRPILTVAPPGAVDDRSSAPEVLEAEVVRVEGDEK